MDIPTIGFYPEGEDGLWVFRISMPGVGQISRGEVKLRVPWREVKPRKIEIHRYVLTACEFERWRETDLEKPPPAGEDTSG